MQNNQEDVNMVTVKVPIMSGSNTENKNGHLYPADQIVESANNLIEKSVLFLHLPLSKQPDVSRPFEPHNYTAIGKVIDLDGNLEYILCQCTEYQKSIIDPLVGIGFRAGIRGIGTIYYDAIKKSTVLEDDFRVTHCDLIYPEVY